MNRKKITLLLTGLAIASSMFMGCSSSNNNGSSNGSGNVAQGNGGLRRATDRTVTDYNGDEYQADGMYGQYPATNYQENAYSYPNVSYAGDITGIDNENGIMSGVGGNTNNAQYIDDNYAGNNETNNVGINGGNTPNINPSSSVSNYGMSGSYDTLDKNNINEYSTDNVQTPMNGLNGFGDITGDNGTMNNMVTGSGISEANSESGANDSLSNMTVPGVGGATEGIGEIPHTSTQQGTINTKETTTTENIGNASNYSLPDTASTQVSAGKMNVIRSIGGVELTGESGSKKPQGIIQVSFTLSGDVLSTPITSASNATLDSIIQSAYTETLADANTGFTGTGTKTERTKLQKALEEIFTSTGDVKILLQDSKGQTISIPYKSANVATGTNGRYVRHIIDLEGMNKSSVGAYSARAASSDIPISLIIRNQIVDNSGNDELLTDTTYTFIGLSGAGVSDGKLPIKGDKYLTGFTVPSCTTGKAPSTIEIKSKGATNVLYESTDFTSQAGSEKSGTVYTTEFNKKLYVDMRTYDTADAQNVVAGGTTIKLKNFIFKDPDDSIKSIEIKDSDNKTYPCNLVSVDVNDDSKGKYLEVTGLSPDSGYIFTDIDVTSNTRGEDEKDTIQLREKDTSKVVANTKKINTIAFSEPKIELGAAGPKQNVKLPGGLEVQAVKNDSTALRYILKVDNSNGNTGELRVASLREGEKSKVQKIVDKKTNTNFYVVTLTNLTPDTNYDFVTLELDYTDFDNKAGVSRVSLAQVNSKREDRTVDNTTETSPVADKNSFQVDVVTNNTSDYPRSASIPVFIDDMNGRFIRMDYTVTGENKDNIKAEYDGVDTLQVTGLVPNREVTLNLSFVYNDDNGSEQSVKKYVQIKTPQVGDIDIISDTATVSGNEVSIKLAYNGTPKSNIKSVVIKDENGKEIGASWNSETNTITLKGLDANKDYRGLVATFTLENTNKVKYKLTDFSTKDEIVKPTGKVADFVARVYKVALGRDPEVEGWNFWIDKLQKKEITATEFIAENLMTQPEFIERELNKQEFVTTMYTLIVNREPDKDGQSYWEGKYDEYRQVVTSVAELRIKIAKEMMDQPEFKELVSSLGLKY